MVPLTPHVMGTPQSPSLTLSVFLAPSGGQPVLMEVLIISSQLPQLAILQPPLEVTVDSVSVQHGLHLAQSPTMNSTVDVSEVVPCRSKLLPDMLESMLKSECSSNQ